MASEGKQSNDGTTGDKPMQTIASNQLLPQDATQLDEVDQYFECITECPTSDNECKTACVDAMRDEAQLDVHSY